MAAAMSKRNQARNEKALQDLLKTVPGNDRCADCSARNPGWASWSLGVFLCMRCAALHRKLGTHISKVKSLSMDSWSNEQVENMRKIGNVNSNKIWNPRNKQPIVPIDADEVDGAVERYIRDKYERKLLAGNNAPTVAQVQSAAMASSPVATSSPRSTTFSREREESPPPIKPEKGKRFGFGLRSATSTFHLGKPKGRERKSSLPAGAGRVVGATIGLKEDELGWKLVTLKEMGFADEKRNTEILKGLNGDLERTIESLVRLGQASGSSDAQLRKQVSQKFERDPNRFPQPPERSSSKPVPQSAGIMGATVRQSPQTTGFSGAQSAASSPGLSRQANNPFNSVQVQQPQAQSAFEQAFSNMSIAQPLSSQSTGILPSQQPTQQTIYQQSMTPPPGSVFQQQQSPYNPYLQQQQQQQQQNMLYSNQQLQVQAAYQPIQPQMTGNNPFVQVQAQMQSPNIQQMQPQPLQSPNPFLQQQSLQPQATSNPFLQQANMVSHGFNQLQQPQQSQYVADPHSYVSSPTGFHSPGLPVQSPQMTGQHNPFQQQMMQQMQPQPLQQQQSLAQQQQQQQQFQAQQFQAQQFQAQQFQQPQMQPLAAQPTGRLNKQNIMALYSYSQVAPQPSIPEDQVANISTPASPGQPAQMPGNIAGNRRSVTMPIMSTGGTNNPFAAAGSAAPGQAPAAGGNRDSIFMDSGSDPFASLSAKFVR